MSASAARLVRTSASAALLTGGSLAAAWLVFTRVQGDSRIEFASDGLTPSGTGLGGQIELVNRGRQLAAVLRVGGRVVEGPPGKVLVTRHGTQAPEPGFWVSNLLAPGESCLADVDVELAEQPTGPVVIELDVQEIGRRPVVHRRARFHLPASGA